MSPTAIAVNGYPHRNSPGNMSDASAPKYACPIGWRIPK
jgi:hypothetical protein